jgi:hypothetical protein
MYKLISCKEDCLCMPIRSSPSLSLKTAWRILVEFYFRGSYKIFSTISIITDVINVELYCHKNRSTQNTPVEILCASARIAYLQTY